MTPKIKIDNQWSSSDILRYNTIHFTTIEHTSSSTINLKIICVSVYDMSKIRFKDSNDM